MRKVKSKFLILCIFAGLLAVMVLPVQTANAATWSFHFSYAGCPGGNLYVYATKDCARQLLLFQGYAVECQSYSGYFPGDPYNDIVFDFHWDYACQNEDHFKIALPGWDGDAREWKLGELPSWIDAQLISDLVLPSIGDPSGTVAREVHLMVDLAQWFADPRSLEVEYTIVDGECDDLPGYLIGTTPITFNPHAGPNESPFSTTPFNGTLQRDGDIIISPGQPGPPSFEQLDWVGPFDYTANSSWGKVTLEVDEPAGFYYLNLSVDTDASGVYAWVIRNRGIESTGEHQTISSFFDVFYDDQNYEPHDVTSLDYIYSIDLDPQQTAPTGTTGTADVIGVPYQVGGESDEIVGPLPYLVDPGDCLCTVTKSGRLPNLGQFVNQPQGNNQCAPGAISNSLKYLQATGGVDPTVPTDIGTVGGQIGTTASGTPASWYLKKQQLPYFTNIVTTRYITPPLTDTEIDDLIKELNRGQDIEVDLRGHVEVLVGLRKRCDGTIELDLFDDNQTDNVSDPMHTSTIDESTTPPEVDGMELERFVIECPVEAEAGVLLPYFFLDTFEDWQEALSSGLIRAMTLPEGQDYLWQWDPANPEVEVEGEPYPQDPFIEPFPPLYVYEGGGAGGYEPNDAGLVMGWGDLTAPESSTSAWVVKYDEDPVLTNCIITLVVTAPQWSITNPGSQINNVSFGIGNPPTGSGPVRSWSWACGLTSTPATPIAWNTPTTLTIDTSQTGTAAATPTATGYTNNGAFTLQNVTWLSVDENGTWIGNANQAMPGPGGGFQFLWNYWHWILVTPKTTVDKGIYKKWSQPPVVLDPNDDPPVIQGWDELSNYDNMPVVADDWQCDNDRPVTDIHWWGSYLGWTQPSPPALPRAFHIGIWTNVPDSNVNDPLTYSRPDLLIWENYCDNYVWNFAGYDRDPRVIYLPGEEPNKPGNDEPMDSCFQFTQLLSQEEWFHQEPNDDPCNPTVYWLSIAPIWDNNTPAWEWGWKTRLPKWNDDAVSITMASPWWPPVVGSTTWVSGVPVQYPPYPVPDGDFVSWDVAFELTTNEPAYEDDPISGDLNADRIVNLFDIAILAGNWLATNP